MDNENNKIYNILQKDGFVSSSYDFKYYIFKKNMNECIDADTNEIYKYDKNKRKWFKKNKWCCMM
jgi:hypothetical protein